MKAIGLNGKEYTWKLIGHVPLGDDERSRSKFHLTARELLTKLFALDRILEEVPLPGSDGLTADFFILAERLMVEVHGQQHYQFVPHFHVDKLGFFASKKRDMNKRKWCELNNICLVELPYQESSDEWAKRIRERKIGNGKD